MKHTKKILAALALTLAVTAAVSAPAAAESNQAVPGTSKPHGGLRW